MITCKTTKKGGPTFTLTETFIIFADRKMSLKEFYGQTGYIRLSENAEHKL